MSTDAASNSVRSPFEQLRFAREVLRTESQALSDLATGLGEDFCEAVELIHASGGVILSGMGKAGLVARKISATLSSTGTNSHFLHPAEAIHGDLGAVRPNDVAVVLSFSGETEETLRLLPCLDNLSVDVIAITRSRGCSLGRSARVVLELGALREACHMGLAPSTSTTAMMALGDALALTVSRRRGFGSTDFARFHPGGSLGRKLTLVDDLMRPLDQCRFAEESHSVRDVLTRQATTGRRSGAILLTDAVGRLSGIFTDSDLARMLAGDRWFQLDAPIAEAMTTGPKTIASGQTIPAAVALLERYKISELPVVDDDRRPLGLIDITDVVGLTMDAEMSQGSTSTVASANLDVAPTVLFSNPPRNSA